MRYYYPAEAMRRADARAIAELGVPGAILMENAGRGAADAIERAYPGVTDIVFLCGPGNNGGDGFVAARQMAARGAEPVVITTAPRERYTGDAASALAAYVGCGKPLMFSGDMMDFEIDAMLGFARVVVDALLGTGAEGEPRGEAARLMARLSQSACREVVSLDIPSGVSADTGEAWAGAVRARMTVTFLARKTGLAVAPGSLCAGLVEDADIGVPRALALRGDPALYGLDRTDIQALAPHAPLDAHKGTRGGVLIAGGCDTFRGAPLLAARGALRAGCGLVFLAVPDFIAQSAAAALPEAIILSVASEDGAIIPGALAEAIAPWTRKIDAAVVGPGLGRSRGALGVVRYFAEGWDKPLLLDADALFLLSRLGQGGMMPNVMITPHSAEAGTLLGISPADVAACRFTSCRALAERFGTVLLKGPGTLVARGPITRVISEGGPELAVPGSGDVLSGVIGALAARGMPPLDACSLGALAHALAGSLLGARDGILAGELADAIPAALAWGRKGQ